MLSLAHSRKTIPDRTRMSKIIDEPIVMLGAEHQRPGQAFIWRNREHTIQSVGGRWSCRGRWWIGEGARRYFRITTLANVTLDLCFDELTHSWTVAELWD